MLDTLRLLFTRVPGNRPKRLYRIPLILTSSGSFFPGKYRYYSFYTIENPPKIGETVPLFDTGISSLYYKVKKIHKVDKVPEFSFDDGLVYDLVYHHSTVSPDPDLNKIISKRKK